jgi:hypothetical protein
MTSLSKRMLKSLKFCPEFFHNIVPKCLGMLDSNARHFKAMPSQCLPFKVNIGVFWGSYFPWVV